MIVSDSHKFIYARVPKTGSTSISSALAKYRRMSERVRCVDLLNQLFCQILRKKNIKFSTYPHLSLHSAKQIIGSRKFNSYFRFSVVRHPVDRIYSQYRHVKRNLSCPKFQAMYPEMLGHRAGFECFLEAMQSRPIPPQVSMLIDEHGKIQTNAVARIECLNEELSPIFEQLGLKCVVERLNVGGVVQNGSSDLTNRARDLIERMYQIDYECFGYDRFAFKRHFQFEEKIVRNVKALTLGESIWQRVPVAA